MVEYKTSGRVAILELNNPPVNTLCLTVRQGIARGLSTARKDANIEAIVICGRNTFIAGADIKEFSTGASALPPGLKDVCFMIEECEKPVVSAVHGVALGGGLEIALSSHYRIGHSKARFGFPEVELGILPAATGTQRLPRVAGLKVALDLIPTGRIFGANEALNIGVIDKIATDTEVLPEALTFARSVINKPLSGRRTSRGPVKGACDAHQLQEDAIAKAKKKSPGLMAPIFNIKAVMASVEFPREEALRKEQDYADLLFSSSQASALQYAFFVQRAAPKWEIPGASYKTVKPRKLQTGAVVGAGTMGTGIAVCMLNAGIPVVLLEQNVKNLNNGLRILKNHYSGSVRRGKISEEQAKKYISLLHPTLDISDLRDVDVVVEAVYEDLHVKADVFKKLDAVCKPEAYIWTNTSFLDIDELSAMTSRPDKVMGFHFFVPAFFMKLVEVVRGEHTSSVTMATGMAFAQKLRKVPVLVGNCHGFVANRTNQLQVAEANCLIEEGSFVEDVDKVLEDFGFPMGAFKVRDLAGLDIDFLMRKGLADRAGVTFDQHRRVLYFGRHTNIHDRLNEEFSSRLGMKTGQGYYRYGTPHARVPFSDPWMRDYTLKHSEKYGMDRRQISNQEILERQIYPAINVGFKCLEEGIVGKPEDVDAIWLLGLGWPKQLGGPMFYAEMVGLRKIYDKVCYYSEKFPAAEHWKPSKLLRIVAQNNIPMELWVEHIPTSCRL